MYGDYEAQRHWMEITTHLPIAQWYFHDLQWWGLDYPPLTAYHSWLMGKIGSAIDPSWFALYASRGIEEGNLKVFMRATVLISEYIVYIPAAVIFVRRFSRQQGVQTWDASLALAAILMQPATILIDHVHFQYNSVMLGLVLASASSVLAGRHMWSCVFFVAALGFKQMALYYAPAMFAYLLGTCIFPKLDVARFSKIATVTATSFAALLLPLLIGSFSNYRQGIDAQPELDGAAPTLPIFGCLEPYVNPLAWYFPIIHQVAQLIFRIFPFSRGLFEDKVANIWCLLNIPYKLRQLPIATLQRVSMFATLAAITPPCLIVLLRPRRELLPLGLATTAWAFFLLSFQVHEKSVLLPLMPMTMLLSSKDGLEPSKRSWISFANLLGAWTLFPLLSRVQLRVPYAVLTLLWAYLLGLPPVSFKVYRDMGFKGNFWAQGTVLVHAAFYLIMIFWHCLEVFVIPPKDLPDLWTVANVATGAIGFGLCYLWCLGRLAVESRLFATGESAGQASRRKKI